MESVRITDDEPIYINRTFISPVICHDYLNNEIGRKRTCDITLLFLTETEYDQSDRPYQYSQIVFRGDKIMLSFDFVSDN